MAAILTRTRSFRDAIKKRKSEKMKTDGLKSNESGTAGLIRGEIYRPKKGKSFYLEKMKSFFLNNPDERNILIKSFRKSGKSFALKYIIDYDIKNDSRDRFHVTTIIIAYFYISPKDSNRNVSWRAYFPDAQIYYIDSEEDKKYVTCGDFIKSIIKKTKNSNCRIYCDDTFDLICNNESMLLDYKNVLSIKSVMTERSNEKICTDATTMKLQSECIYCRCNVPIPVICDHLDF